MMTANSAISSFCIIFLIWRLLSWVRESTAGDLAEYCEVGPVAALEALHPILWNPNKINILDAYWADK